jgi:hypothetical protein
MTNTNGGALARVEEPGKVQHAAEWEGLKLVVSPAEALARMKELQAFIQEVMVDGLDYGKIPGVDKPTLFQPGAQKLCEIYGLAWEFRDEPGTIQDWTLPLFVFKKKCVLTTRRDSRYVGDGIGSCNSKEDRYAWRWVFSDKLPAGVDKSNLKTKPTRNSGVMYRLANDDIYSLVNTIEKMACKRSLVHAVLGATRTSGIFSQDVEDLPADVFGEAGKNRSWETDGKKDDGAIVADLTKKLLEAKDAKALGVAGRAVKDAKPKLSDESQAKLRELYAECSAKLKPSEPAAESSQAKEPKKSSPAFEKEQPSKPKQEAVDAEFEEREPGAEG